MAKKETTQTTEVAVPNSPLPSYLQGVQSSSYSNMTSEDLIIPRIQLLQSTSPKVIEDPRNAFPGHFWHNINDTMVAEGKEFDFIAFRSRRYYVLFAPRGDDRTVLARADDGIHWSPSSGEFKVKPKKSPKEVVYKMAPTVAESGLAKFGTSIPGDENSPPAATLVYEYLVWLPDFPDMGPAVITLARSQIARGKVINAAINMSKAPMTALKFTAKITQEMGDEGPYFNWIFKKAGFATEAQFKEAEGFALQFADAKYKAAGDEDSGDGGEGAPKDVPQNAKGF